MPPRHFLLVRNNVEAVIRRGVERDARLAAVSIVDDWAASVIAAHLGTTRLPIQVIGEFAAAEATSFFGILGAARDQPAEVSRWVFECNCLMNDRLHFWALRSLRFRSYTCPKDCQSPGWRA